jgi:hypothetical protein
VRFDPEEFDPGREYDRYLDMKAEDAYFERLDAISPTAGTFDGELLTSGDSGDPYWTNL